MANAFKRRTSRNISTAWVAVGGYTVPANTQINIIGLSIANVGTGATSVSVTLYDATNSTYLVKSVPIPLGGTLIVVGGDQKVVLQPGDQILVQTATGGMVDVIMSTLEIA